jgi:hypothetical protein
MTNGYGIDAVNSNVTNLIANATGLESSAINADMKLSSLGFDEYRVVHLVEKINAQSWMHGVRIQANEIRASATVGDVVRIIYSKIKQPEAG